MSMRVCYSDCNSCGEVQVSTESSFNVITECGCGTNVEDVMVEEDRLYPVYQQVFGTFAMTVFDDSPIKHYGRLKSLKHRRVS